MTRFGTRIRTLINFWRIRETDTEKATFRNMMLITYGITIVAVASSLCIQFDACELTTLAKLNEHEFSFGCIEGIPWGLYILATVGQSLVTTTLTFAGSVLILQSLSGQTNTGKRSSLFVAIISLAILGVIQFAAKTQLFLMILSFGAVFLSIVTLCLSKSTFSLQMDDSPSNRKRKGELTDCRPCA